MEDMGDYTTNMLNGLFIKNDTNEIGNITMARQSGNPIDLSLVEITKQIELYCNLILVPVGSALNIWTFVTFYTMRTHQSAPGLHLMCIAIADTITIIGLFFYRSINWIKYIDIPIFMNMHVVLCKGIPLVTALGSLWSGLLLLSATVERFVSIAFALKVKLWNLLKISKILIVVTFSVSLALSITWVYFLEMSHFGYCDVDRKYRELYHTI